MAKFFQPNFFQNNFFQIEPGGIVVDTDILHKPIDCVLAGEVPFKDRYRENEVWPRRLRQKATARKSGVARFSGDKPSFTTKTDKKGYD